MPAPHDQGLTDLVENGLNAVHAATKEGRDSAAAIRSNATHTALLALLDDGTRVSESWRERIEAVQRGFGERTDGGNGIMSKAATAAEHLVGASDNPIIDGIYKTGKEASARAKDDKSGDLGIIAAGQLALHYYIAAFGTLGSYLDQLGRGQDAAILKQCADEAKAEDERHTDLARDIMKGLGL